MSKHSDFALTKQQVISHDFDEPMPEGLPIPATYHMFVVQIGLKNKIPVAGTNKFIHLSDDSQDADKWLNDRGKVVALGPACFTHKRYKELGLERDHFPDVGDAILYTATAPTRFMFKGQLILVIKDDQWYAHIKDLSTIPNFTFYA